MDKSNRLSVLCVPVLFILQKLQDLTEVIVVCCVRFEVLLFGSVNLSAAFYELCSGALEYKSKSSI